jgi:hypothetical protein
MTHRDGRSGFPRDGVIMGQWGEGDGGRLRRSIMLGEHRAFRDLQFLCLLGVCLFRCHERNTNQMRSVG